MDGGYIGHHDIYCEVLNILELRYLCGVRKDKDAQEGRSELGLSKLSHNS